MTTAVSVPVLPAASVAEQVTVVEPSGKTLPEAWSHDALPEILPSVSSTAETVKLAGAPEEKRSSMVGVSGEMVTIGVLESAILSNVLVTEQIFEALSSSGA